MFRQPVSRLFMGITGIAGMQMAAAGVVQKPEEQPPAEKFDYKASDKRLKKKPEWYRFAVRELEMYIRKFSTYGFIEVEGLTNNAIEWFEKCEDSNNPEILWRLARAYVEKAKLDVVENRIHYLEQRDKLLEKALEACRKSLARADNSAPAHKWYAIILNAFVEYHPFTAGSKGNALAKKLAPADGDVKAEIKAHLQRAAELDPKDPFTWFLLGLQLFESKEYKRALDCFEKAEQAKPDFSAANIYYMARIHLINKDKPKAKDLFLKVIRMPVRNKFDGRALTFARQHLVFDIKLDAKEVALMGQEDWKYEPQVIYDETVKF